jgi:hypothetical protein
VKKHRYLAASFVGLIKGLLVALIIIANYFPITEITLTTQRDGLAKAATLSSEFGVNGAISSLQGDSAKQSAVNKIVDGGFGWTRNEITYADTIDFTQYDAALTKTRASGISTLGLLSYPGADKSHEQWRNYVTSVVSHFGSNIPAWEIMNEADNYLSAADYTPYLKEAHDIIKATDSSATIVLSGLTSRIEATNFWDGVAAAGGWGYFDEIGLHLYHNGNPEKVNFGGGDLVGEIDRVVGNINKNGGGKNIWITEIGYQTTIGSENQANWLARTLAMSKSVSKVSKLFIYRLYDAGSESYGLLNSDLSEKTAFGRVRDTVSALSGKSSGTKLSPQQQTSLDNFDAVSTKWKTDASSNSQTSLTSETGYKGNGMKISYNFSADSAYTIAEQDIAIAGTPTALGAWFYGDDTKNVWKFRFKDKNGETFQTDLGSISSGWSYKQFSIGTDTAWVSWGGDGKIDFPISFNSFVIDRQSGGSSSASGIVDELSAITGSSDLYAYQYGSTVGWWKASGSDNATLCGASRSFNETPQYANDVNCSETPVASVAQGQSTTSSSGVTKKKSTPVITVKVVADKSKSYVRLDGADIVADGTSFYKIVVGIKDSSDKFILGRAPSILMSGGQTALNNTVQIGNEWIAEVSSTEVGVKTAVIKLDSVELGTLSLNFIPVVVSTPVITEDAPIELIAADPPTTSSPSLDYYLITLWGLSIGVLMMAIGLLIRKIIIAKRLG